MSHPNERLVLFSDAVIAITITLMVLEIRVPHDAGELDDPELWTALLALWPRYVSYILSFVVVGAFWNVHRRKFEFIARSSGTLVWLNFAFLLAIGFMPFVTDLIAENGGSVATMAYAAVVTAIALIGAAMSFYAAAAGLTERPQDPWMLSLPSLSTAAVFGLSILIAAFDADVAKYFWLVLLPVNLIVGRMRGT